MSYFNYSICSWKRRLWCTSWTSVSSGKTTRMKFIKSVFPTEEREVITQGKKSSSNKRGTLQRYCQTSLACSLEENRLINEGKICSDIAHTRDFRKRDSDKKQKFLLRTISCSDCKCSRSRLYDKGKEWNIPTYSRREEYCYSISKLKVKYHNPSSRRIPKHTNGKN